MRVGLLTNLTEVNSAYRALPVLQLQTRGHTLCLGMQGEQLRHEALHGCDVVHIYRYHDRRTRRLAEKLRAAGTAIVWDNDDDLSNIPGERRKGALHSQQARADMSAMVRLADVVTTPSRTLAEHYREWGAEHTEVVENFLPADYAVGAPVSASSGVTIGWTAAGEHRFDLLHLGLREILLELLDARPELRVASIGIDLGLPRDRYRHYPILQYPDLARHVATFDVGIAPIADVAFNRARSNVKVKEYAAVGVPWLASPIGPYAGLGSRQGGELVPDDQWRAALDRLVGNARLRRRLSARGRKWAEGQTVAANLTVWERALSLAVERARQSRAHSAVGPATAPESSAGGSVRAGG